MIENALEDELARRLGRDRVSRSGADRRPYARDLWPLGQIGVLFGRSFRPPDLVVWPRDYEGVAAVLVAARRAGVPVVPVGGGSGVCGGTAAVMGGIALDLKGLDRVLSVDRERLVARAQAGILGETLERRLDAQGVTLGHFPSSIYCSTLGGWLAARSAGQLSTYYGKIEDRVLDLVLVTSEGETFAASELAPGCPAAEAAQLVVGTEGTAAVLVEATLAVHPRPERREFLAARFGTVERGLDAIRDLLQAGVVPAAVRLYDHLDTLLVARPREGEGNSPLPFPAAGTPHRAEGAGVSSRLLSGSGPAARRRLAFLLRFSALANFLGPALPGGCLLLLTFEGPRELAFAGARIAAARLERSRGTLLGPEPARAWWEHRYDVSYKQSPVYDRGGVVDTIEVAATWDRLVPLYRRMRAAIGRRALVLAHFSHAYREGCSIYFTFIHPARSFERAGTTYAGVWRLALEACLDAGGTITHHHGVGLLKRAAYAAERKGAWGALETLATAFDRAGILNPGKLGKLMRPGPNPASDGL